MNAGVWFVLGALTLGLIRALYDTIRYRRLKLIVGRTLRERVVSIIKARQLDNHLNRSYRTQSAEWMTRRPR